MHGGGGYASLLLPLLPAAVVAGLVLAVGCMRLEGLQDMVAGDLAEQGCRRCHKWRIAETVAHGEDFDNLGRACACWRRQRWQQTGLAGPVVAERLERAGGKEPLPAAVVERLEPEISTRT